VAAVAPNCRAQTANTNFKLIYDKPAAKWTEALPLGNGRIGAMDFGGVEEERLQINEDTLWGGGPHDYVNPDANAHLPQIQQLIFAGKVDEAQELSASLMSEPRVLMPYQPFCDIRLHFSGGRPMSDYHCQLDLQQALAQTDYSAASTTYNREVFVSYPDQVLVVRLSASRPGQIAFSISMDSPQPGVHVESTSNDTLQLTGQIQPRQNPPTSWIGSWNTAGLRFAAVLKVSTEGGLINSAGDHLDRDLRRVRCVLLVEAAPSQERCTERFEIAAADRVEVRIESRLAILAIGPNPVILARAAHRNDANLRCRIRAA
jgi:alpha-L-fucosidase 2